MPNSKQYDLEDRTYEFARSCREFIKGIDYSVSNREDSKQLARSSGSVAANYIEANESLSKKDFVMRMKISRKEAKETILWLRLLNAPKQLLDEATEKKKILSAIIVKSS